MISDYDLVITLLVHEDIYTLSWYYLAGSGWKGGTSIYLIYYYWLRDLCIHFEDSLTSFLGPDVRLCQVSY